MTAVVAATVMIFTPHDRGISHNEKESTSTRLEDALLGVNVLLYAVLERADGQS
jgi:hypothetical protein